MTRGRKPKWFSLLKKKIIEKAEERTIKPEWISGQLNQSASSILLPEITNDKRKKEWILSEEGEAFKIREKKDKSIQVEHWRTVLKATKIETRIEKCSGCKHNRSTVEGNCTMRIKFDEDTYHRDLPENEQEFKELRSLEYPKKELILQAELNEKLKDKILAILTRNLNHQQRKYCCYTDGFFQKEDKEKGDTVVMEAAVVQVNKKEEVSLEKVSAYTTG
ncbi:4826_t:CDS:2 [Gigaspora margarita]|uniref:4826_t:CDS:1 n=1 Tax=Gigaspora margarita TaxID=4874 RepID=A0ABN7UTS3_GIGMA|nr:4826_t:CDS:2 [Gigaspora margarita]